MRKNPDLIGSKEAAEILHKSVSQVNRLASIGRLAYITKAHGLRGPYLFDRSEVERWALLRGEAA